MTTPEIFKFIIAPIASPILAGVFAYLGALKGRNAAYSQELFSRHLEASSEIVPFLFKLVSNNESKGAFDRYREFEEVFGKWHSCLPSNVVMDLLDFREHLITKTTSLDLLADFDFSHIREDERNIHSILNRSSNGMAVATSKVIASFRDTLGTEPLSGKLLKQFHPHPKKTLSEFISDNPNVNKAE